MAKYTGNYPNIRTHYTNDDVIQGCRAFAKKYAANNKYGYKKWKSGSSKAAQNTHKCPLCHPKSGKGWNCIGFVTACYYHGGKVKSIKCSNSGLANNSFGNSVTQKSWHARNGKNWKMISNGGKRGGKKIPVKKLKPADALMCFDNNGKYTHMAFYYGNGKIVDSRGSNGKIPKKKQISIRKYSSVHATRAFRYTGKGDGYRNYIKINDKGTQVKRVQKYFNWLYGEKTVKVDGIYGSVTRKIVKKFQAENGLDINGRVDKATLKKMKQMNK